MKQQGGEDGAVALALDCVGLGRIEQFAGLVIAECRRLAFATLRPRTLNAFDRDRHAAALGGVNALLKWTFS
jgi:hypothetical protein